MSDFEPNKATLKRALCYIPLLAIIFSVVEKDNKDLILDIRYWVLLFVFWIIFSMIWGILWLSSLIFLIYIGTSWYLGFKAYNNEKIQIDFLDQAYEKIIWFLKKDAPHSTDSKK